ncbi:MAG: Asp-tRNA(Asn)/Glu-tRNA(Gln) amidotransferase subunit GatC [Bacillota bacterium]
MISKEEIMHIAELARLELTEDEIDMFTRQLGDILDSFEKLDELDTEKIEPTAYTIPVRNVMRKDQVEESLERDQVLKNAPDKREGQFRVPPISAD